MSTEENEIQRLKDIISRAMVELANVDDRRATLEEAARRVRDGYASGERFDRAIRLAIASASVASSILAEAKTSEGS